MRNYLIFVCIVTIFLVVDFFMIFNSRSGQPSHNKHVESVRLIVKELGLSDLAISTEARYTRHPAVSDPVVPFMDHPGNIEHFPSGSFWFPVE